MNYEGALKDRHGPDQRALTICRHPSVRTGYQVPTNAGLTRMARELIELGRNRRSNWQSHDPRNFHLTLPGQRRE